MIIMWRRRRRREGGEEGRICGAGGGEVKECKTEVRRRTQVGSGEEMKRILKTSHCIAEEITLRQSTFVKFNLFPANSLWYFF
jgi:hypothetical protein